MCAPSTSRASGTGWTLCPPQLHVEQPGRDLRPGLSLIPFPLSWGHRGVPACPLLRTLHEMDLCGRVLHMGLSVD